jgi:hypothetical protein
MGLIRLAAEPAHIGQKVQLMIIYIVGVYTADPGWAAGALCNDTGIAFWTGRGPVV